MNRTAHTRPGKSAHSTVRSAVFGYWRSYWFGYYFTEQGAPGD